MRSGVLQLIAAVAVQLIVACAADPAVAPDAAGCPTLPMDGWYPQSGSCVSTVEVSPERREELSGLRDAFVVFIEACPAPDCGPAPAVPPMPTTTVCSEWKAWDADMGRVAAWAQCADK